MLTRELLQLRLLKLATTIELFGNRKSTSADDRTWAAATIASLITTVTPGGHIDLQPRAIHQTAGLSAEDGRVFKSCLKRIKQRGNQSDEP